MFCPDCVKEGKRSRVYPDLSSVTLMHGVTFWDEGGRLHQHDPNITTTGYTCSEGHTWVEQAGPREHPCNWGDFP